MIKVGTVLNVCDNSGIKKVKCIKILGYSKKKYASIGNKIKISALKITDFTKYNKGELFNAIVVRTKYNYKRFCGSNVRFNENSVVVLNNKDELLFTRIIGPVLYELKYNVYLGNKISKLSNLIV